MSDAQPPATTPADLVADPARVSDLRHNLHDVQAAVSQAEAETEASSNRRVQLVAVSKYMPERDIQALYDAGQRHFGENYVQELLRKAEILPRDIRWHFIGTLQTNKCKQLARVASLHAVETVDGAVKAQKLNDARAAELPPLHVYLQINTSREAQKSGLDAADDAGYAEIRAAAALVAGGKCPRLRLAGLMTIGARATSLDDTAENSDFATLAALARRLDADLAHDLDADTARDTLPLGLSMGMSADYAEAIRQGSTSVRVGRTIFGARPTKE